MNDQAKPTPYEIASLAALLALNNKRASGQLPVNFVPEAFKLWTTAARYLLQPDGLDHEWMLKTLGHKTYTFDEVLKPVGHSQNRKKKAHTMAGSITTEGGLFKAIRRLFPDRAEEIKGRGELYQVEIDVILADQAKRNHNRTQAATMARSKTVKRKL